MLGNVTYDEKLVETLIKKYCEWPQLQPGTRAIIPEIKYLLGFIKQADLLVLLIDTCH